jgi:hypothetical protein
MSNNIFNTDLTKFNEFNNCLNIDNFNKNSNLRVLINIYNLGFNFNSQITARYLPNLSQNNNSIIPDNIYPNSDLRILTYIYIPDDKFYKFKVTYPVRFNIYLNNYKYKILDNSLSNNISQDDIIKKGIYLLCIDLESSKEPFKLEYAIDKTNNWQSINNLLLDENKCKNQINSSLLLDQFLLSGIEYCKNNINTNDCKNFYSKIENNLVNSYLDNINNTKYPSSIDGKYTEWSISDNNWNSNDPNIFGSCGKGLVRQRVRNYENALYGGQNNYGDKLNSYVEAVGPYKTETQTKDIFCFPDNTSYGEDKKTISDITNYWNSNLRCTNILSNTSTPNLNDLRYISTKDKLYSELNKYDFAQNKDRITNSNLISHCYQDYNSQVSSLLLTKSNQNNNQFETTAKNIIYPNISYSNDYEWINSNFKLIIQSDGNLVLYSIKLNKILWQTNTSGNNNARLSMQRDGNLVIYNTNKQPIWSSGTNNNIGNKFELTETGQLIMNTLNTLFSTPIKCLNPFTLNNIKDYYDTYGNYFQLNVFNMIYQEDNKIIYPYIKYSNGFNWNNNGFKFRIQNDGHLILTNNNDQIQWNSGKSGGEFNNSYLISLNDGILYYKRQDNSNIDQYTMYNNLFISDSFKHFELSNTGYIVAINTNNQLANVLLNNNIESNIKNTRVRIKQNLINQYTNNPQNKNIERLLMQKAYNKTKCIDMGNNAPYYSNCNENNQYHRFIYTDDNLIKSQQTSACLDSNGINIYAGSCNPSNNFQKFTLESDFRIRHNQSNKCLDGNGNELYMSDCNINDNKVWLNGLSSSYISNNTNILKQLINNNYHNSIINDPLKDLINIFGGYKWSENWKQSIIEVGAVKSSFTNKSIFTNKSNFANNLNLSIVESFNSNNECNISNILLDPNCNSVELNVYKNYIKNMNDYCKLNDNSINNNECINYQNKSYIDKNNKTVKFDTIGKLSLIKKQEELCKKNENYINDNCIEINSKKSNILKEQGDYCKSNDNINICNELTEKYNTLAKLSKIENGQLNFNNYKIFNKCKENNEDYILNNNCIKLMNNNSFDSNLKDELIQIQEETCLLPLNYTHANCLEENLNNKKQLNKITEYCKTNINDKNCIEFCQKNKDNNNFKNTEFYEEICQPWTEKYLWLIILFIVVIFLSSGSLFNKRRNMSRNINRNSNRNVS